MKVLIAAGSFKDVFTTTEACKMISDMLQPYHDVKILPVCDGGEYTLETLSLFWGSQASCHIVDDIVNPYGKRIKASYISVENTAYIVSSEVLHLSLEEDAYKNPLQLTDYGLGQLVSDAIDQGFKDIRLCLGGTSTVGFGFGTAQALGAVFLDKDENEIPAPVMPEKYCDICTVKWPEKRSGIKLSVINDGITKASDLNVVNPLKIGKAFSADKQGILSGIDRAMEAVFRLTGYTAEDDWSGNAGGIYYGINKLFDAGYYKGADYFCELFGLNALISESDIVITGEGRFDNPHLKKIPVVVSEYALRKHKPVIFVCGQLAEEWKLSSFSEKEGVYHSSKLEQQYGIHTVLSCDDYYVSQNMSDKCDTGTYKKYTPIILKERFKQIGVIS